MAVNKLTLLKKIVLIGILISFNQVVFGQNLKFQKTYTADDLGTFVANWLQTKDGGFLLCGMTYPGDLAPNGWYNGNSYIVKTNSKGEIQWTKMFQITDSLGGRNTDFAYSAVETTDGGYAFTGWIARDNFLPTKDIDVLLFKTDGNGNPQWAKCFGGAKQDRGHDLKLASDGGYIITGITDSYGGGERDDDLYLIKTDNNGKLKWTKTYGDATTSSGYSDGGSAIYNLADGGYLILGSNLTQGSIANSIPPRLFPYILKTDKDGNAKSAFAVKPSAEAINCYGGDIKMTSDGGYIVTGRAQNFSVELYGFLMKLKSDFSIEWTKGYSDGVKVMPYGVTLATDGGYAIMGYSKNWIDDEGNADLFIIKTGNDGSVKWGKAYGSQDEHYHTSGVESNVNLYQTADKGFMTAIVQDNRKDTTTSMLLVKTDSLGSTGCDEVSITGNIEKNLTGVLLQRTTQPLSQNKGKEHTVNIKVDAAAQVEKAICFTEGIEDPGMENAEFSVFPNPANDYLNIQFNISDFRPQTSDFLIQIYDITGKLVKQMSTDNELLKTIDISGLNKGLYFISLINKDKIINAKFIKE